jgi:hypothetical protein
MGYCLQKGLEQQPPKVAHETGSPRANVVGQWNAGSSFMIRQSTLEIVC